MFFTDLPAETDNLTFATFESLFSERLGIPVRTPDTWITLGLFNKDTGYTNAALVVSDQNSFPGIDVVFYGDSRRIIRRRGRLENRSVFDLIQECVNLFETEYTYETVEGFYRVKKERIPVSCFRGLITNMIIHRDWQSSAFMKAEFFEDHAIVTAPVRNPCSKHRDNGTCDIDLLSPRNPSLAFVFYRLGQIETLGFPLSDLLDVYDSSLLKPDCLFTENMISISLPELESRLELTNEQNQIYHLILNAGSISPSQLQAATGLTKSMVQRSLRVLLDLNLLSRTGKARAVRYSIRQSI